MKRTYETKVITIIFKNGESATFENCLDIYTMEGEYNIIFACDDSRIMAAKGYVDALEVD